MKSTVLLIIVSIVAMSAFASGVPEEEVVVYPERNVRIIIPWSVGGMTDVLTRPIAQWLEEYFETPFVVENKPGGGGVV